MKKYTYICGVASKEDAFIFYIEDGVLLSALINLVNVILIYNNIL